MVYTIHTASALSNYKPARLLAKIHSLAAKAVAEHQLCAHPMPLHSHLLTSPIEILLWQYET